MPIDFANLSLLIADTPAQIRRNDVYRLLEEAQRLGVLEDCAVWLLRQRPDLLPTIAADLQGLTGEVWHPTL